MSLSTLKTILPVLFLFSLPAVSQDLPKQIRGYTVYRESIVIKTGVLTPGEKSSAADAVVKIGDPVPADISLSGLTLELPAEFTAARQSGKVHFLTFHAFRVDGIPVHIPEYAHPFSFQKRETVKLPQPATIFLPTTRMLQAAWKEMRETRKEWTVKGRIFVFGKFRKFGSYHKRVVPIDIDITIRNPLRSPETKPQITPQI